MKKFMLIALALVMVLALCACGDDPATTDPTGTTGGQSVSNEPKGYTFTYNGVKVGVDVVAGEALAKLPEADEKFTSASCAFGGNDTVYYYGSSVQISTNDELGYERIFSIYLADDLVSTEEGVCIDNTVEQVKTAYGEPGAKSTDNSMVYEKDGMTLTFIINNGKVSSIRYDA